MESSTTHSNYNGWIPFTKYNNLSCSSDILSLILIFHEFFLVRPGSLITLAPNEYYSDKLIFTY